MWALVMRRGDFPVVHREFLARAVRTLRGRVLNYTALLGQ